MTSLSACTARTWFITGEGEGVKNIHNSAALVKGEHWARCLDEQRYGNLRFEILDGVNVKITGFRNCDAVLIYAKKTSFLRNPLSASSSRRWIQKICLKNSPLFTRLRGITAQKTVILKVWKCSYRNKTVCYREVHQSV